MIHSLVWTKADSMQKSQITVKRYTEARKEQWDSFIATAKNGHFMFNRNYMDYHSNRFTDHSLIFEEKHNILALIPANIDKNQLISHAGLTFGGVISNIKMTNQKMLDIFDVLQNYASAEGISSFLYKAIPWIYSTIPSEEDLYALFVNNAQLYRRDVSSAIIPSQKIPYSKGQKYNIKKSLKNKLTISTSTDFTDFWQLLTQVLISRHNAQAVHSLNEITLLSNYFPENIKLHETRGPDNDLLAGAVLYINHGVVHCQYLASSESGKKLGALDFLIDNLLGKYADQRFFDFGISTTENGLNLNHGLSQHKEGFGGRAFVHDFYKLSFK